MKFELTAQEIRLLEDQGIAFDAFREYTDAKALGLLDRVREIEVSYAQYTGGTEETLYFRYGSLADKIHSQIPED